MDAGAGVGFPGLGAAGEPMARSLLKPARSAEGDGALDYSAIAKAYERIG